MAEADFAAETEDAQGAAGGRITIDGRYVVDATHRLADLAHCPTFAAHDSLAANATVVALAPGAFAPARPDAQKMARMRSPHLLTTHILDDSTGSVWIICDAPPGPSLVESSGWSENAVLERLIEPLATVLHAFREAGFRHRAIRPDNVFDPGGRFPVRLGPGLASPPALYQPDRFESLTSVICPPAARGNGTIADDIFSLGALAAWLLGGSVPYEGEVPGALTEERMARGSFAVLAGHLSLSPDVASLLAAMLSDDPAARPAPRDLLNAADRKGFVARRPAVASVPLQLGGVRVRSARELAWYAVRYQSEFASVFARGVVERWLAHELGQTQSASRLAAIARESSVSGDSSLSPSKLMEIITVIDPSMPMYWDGLWFWPDSIATMAALAASGSGNFPTDPAALIIAVVAGGRLSRFALLSSAEGQTEICQHIQMVTHQSGTETATDVVRLAYMLNPFQPCLSPRCAEKRFSAAWALLQWLNAVREPESASGKGLLDPYMTAFLLACAHRSSLIEYFDDLDRGASSPWASDLRLLARLQKLYSTGPLAGIAGRLRPHLAALLQQWRSHTTQREKEEELNQVAENGDLVGMFDLLNDHRSVAKDRAAWAAARQEIRVLEAEQDNEGLWSVEVPARIRSEMYRVAAAVGAVTAVAAVCLEVVL